MVKDKPQQQLALMNSWVIWFRLLREKLKENNTYLLANQDWIIFILITCHYILIWVLESNNHIKVQKNILKY